MTYAEVFSNEFYSSYEVTRGTSEHREGLGFFSVGEMGSERTERVKLKDNHLPSHATNNYHQFVGEKKTEDNQKSPPTI